LRATVSVCALNVEALNEQDEGKLLSLEDEAIIHAYQSRTLF